MASREPSPVLRKRPSLVDKHADPKSVTPSAATADATARSSKSTRLLQFVIFSVAISIVTFTFYVGPRNKPLSDNYALCSREGKRIYTVDDANPLAQCLVVRDAYFVDAGSLEKIQERWHSAHNFSSEALDVRYIDNRAIVVPGISDSHVHLLEYGATKQMPLEGTQTIKETVERVKDYILGDEEIRDDKTKFVEGWGWDHTKWLYEQWPTSEHLEQDPIVKGRPIVLQSKDGHALWVSKKVLGSIQPMPEEVDGGVIIRDSSGNPTGVFLDNAQDLIKRPEPTHKMLEKRFTLAVQDAHSLGLTSVHDAGFNPRSLAFFRKQAEDGKLPIRVYGMTYFDETAEYWGDQVTKIVGAGNHRLSARSVKIFADGALRSGGAALYEPYTDNPETRGFMRTEPEILNKVIPQFLRDGWQVNVHAIGDRANGVVLDAFEVALKDANVTALRPRLEHAQILAQTDMARFGDLGVIASVQPTHAISDMWFAEDRLGPERVKGLYAFRSILDHGARITLGSDFPVEDMNPLAGFYAAITRLSPDGKSPHGPGGWFPDQRMSREEALKGMTLDPAYASFTEDKLGSITPGKRADYVILSQNIMSVPANEVLNTKVLATVLDGRLVYGNV